MSPFPDDESNTVRPPGRPWPSPGPVRLVVQIPCFDEEGSLPLVLADIPTEVPGVTDITILVIDDGSSDRTKAVARAWGVRHFIVHEKNLGLAKSFVHGLEASLRLGADVIVNIDGDRQYSGTEIAKLIDPILKGEADVIIGNRGTQAIAHFSPLKKVLQRFGSAVVSHFAGIPVADAVSGFRAFSRKAAERLTVVTALSHTIETIMQAPVKGLILREVRINTNPPLRKSRLIKNLALYLLRSSFTILRTYNLYSRRKSRRTLSLFVCLAILLVSAFDGYLVQNISELGLFGSVAQWLVHGLACAVAVIAVLAGYDYWCLKSQIKSISSVAPQTVLFFAVGNDTPVVCSPPCQEGKSAGARFADERMLVEQI